MNDKLIYLTKNEVFDELRRYFPRLNLLPDDYPFDCVMYDENQKEICYIVIKQDFCQRDESERIKAFADSIRELNANEIPVVIVNVNDSKLLRIGLLSYWEYKRCEYNRNINWRLLGDESASWLNVQLTARHMIIELLPTKYQRFIKTIKLRTDSLIDAEVVYFRMPRETYKMKSKGQLNDAERLHRMLGRIPEEEYPEDALDRLILESIRDIYPSVTIKTDMLLCKTELLDLRQYKDKLCQVGRIVFVDEKNNKRPIDIECYYYPNFRHIGLKPVMPRLIVKNIDLALFDTYEPLSALNI